MLIFVFWLRKQKTPRMPKGRPNILFAINADETSENEVKRVYDGFRKELKRRDLEKLIHHEILPKNREVHTHEQASLLLSESNATVVVFGEYQRGNRNSKPSEQFQTLSFHWKGNTPLNEREQALIAAMEEFPFRIDESETIAHIPKARQGFANLTLFFVALSLTSIGNSIDARPLWADLLKREKAIKSNGKYYRVYRSWWARNEFIFAQYYYRKHLENNLTNTEYDALAEEMASALSAASAILKNYPGYYMLKAISEFHLGNAKMADKTAREGLKRFKADPNLFVSFSLSLGFLALWRGLYDRALKYYRSTQGHSYSTDDAARIVQFIKTVYRNNNTKPELFLGVAFVCDNFNLSQAPISEYEFFLDQTAGISGIDKLASFGAERLNRLSATA